MNDDLTQETLLFAAKVLKFALVWNLIYQERSDAAVASFDQSHSARGTSIEKRSAIFANYVTRWTLRDWKLSGDIETYRTLDAGSYGITINFELIIFGHSKNSC